MYQLCFSFLFCSVLCFSNSLSAFWGSEPDKPRKSDKPNIVVIMGDDIGWYNFSCYHRGIMSSQTPNIDALAEKGALLTDYYAEGSCTAGRANFITGQLPIRTGLTTGPCCISQTSE